MKALLKFESGKVFHAKILYICIAIIVGVILMLSGMEKLTEKMMSDAINNVYEDIAAEDTDGFNAYDGSNEIMNDISGAGDEVYSMGLGNSTGLTMMLSSLAPYVVMVFGVFAAIFICGDFGNETIKNVFSRGYSRAESYFAKGIVTTLALIGLGLIAMLTGFLTGTFMWNIGSGWSGKVIILIILQLLGIGAYSAMFSFLAALMKKMGSTLVISMAVPFVMPLLLSLIDLLIRSEKVSIADYWISGAISAATMSAQTTDLVRSTVISMIYIALFTLCGLALSKKREV